MPRPKKTKDEGTIDIRRAHYERSELLDEETKNETVPCPIFEGVETGRVNVRGSVTKNLGNFNSVRVEVGLELPCIPELSEVDRVYGIASDFVDNKIKQELDIALNERHSIGQANDRPGIKSRIANT